MPKVQGSLRSIRIQVRAAAHSEWPQDVIARDLSERSAHDVNDGQLGEHEFAAGPHPGTFKRGSEVAACWEKLRQRASRTPFLIWVVSSIWVRRKAARSAREMVGKPWSLRRSPTR